MEKTLKLLSVVLVLLICISSFTVLASAEPIVIEFSEEDMTDEEIIDIESHSEASWLEDAIEMELDIEDEYFDIGTLLREKAYRANRVEDFLADIWQYEEVDDVFVLKDDVEVFEGDMDDGMIVTFHYNGDSFIELLIYAPSEMNNSMESIGDFQIHNSTATTTQGNSYGFILPVDDIFLSSQPAGNISSYFGTRNCPHRIKCPGGTCFHGGVDIANRTNWNASGRTIKAVKAGTVVYRSGTGETTWGNVVAINHVGIVTLYAHMIDLNDAPSVNSSVSQGQKIGRIGGSGANSGNDYGHHLHFEV